MQETRSSAPPLKSSFGRKPGYGEHRAISRIAVRVGAFHGRGSVNAFRSWPGSTPARGRGAIGSAKHQLLRCRPASAHSEHLAIVVQIFRSVIDCRAPQIALCRLRQRGHPLPNNAVLNRLRKILSVANPIYISEFWAGISRDVRMKGFSPPKSVILEFCRQAPGLRVDDIVHRLSEQGGSLTRSELKSVCLEMGVNRRTFYLNLVRSPIISRYGERLYGLIGSGESSCFNLWFSQTRSEYIQRQNRRRKDQAHTAESRKADGERKVAGL